ncbi:MAG: hypothetical protein AAFZ15_02255 [Bacteroidota bacterium]
MKNSKLVKLIRTLSHEEFRRFHRYLKSPFFTTNKNLLALYEYLRKYHPDYDSPKLEKEIVFKKIFARASFNYAKFAALTQSMTRLVEDYMLWINMQESPLLRQRHLLKIYNKRNLFEFYERGYVRMLEKLKQPPYRDLEFYQEKLQLHADYYFHPLNNKYDLEDDSLESFSDDLDVFFVIGKYRAVTALKNRERILSKKYPVRFLSTIKENRQEGWLEGHYLVQLYELLFELMEGQQHDTFFAFKKKMFQHYHDLRSTDKELLFYSGLNFAIGQINQGEESFYKEALEWYKLSISSQLIIERGKINNVIFNNVVLLGCREKEFVWTDHFIHNYGKYLSKSTRLDTILFSESLLLFHQKKFQESMVKLCAHSFSKDFQPKVRLTMIRNNFEQFLIDDKYYEVLQSNIEAFEKYITRDKYFSYAKIESHIHCIRIIKKLSDKILERPKKGTLASWLEEEIASRERVVVKDWLREKVETL